MGANVSIPALSSELTHLIGAAFFRDLAFLPLRSLSRMDGAAFYGLWQKILYKRLFADKGLKPAEWGAAATRVSLRHLPPPAAVLTCKKKKKSTSLLGVW